VLSQADLDITDVKGMQTVLEERQPWAVVNATGYGNIDKAEQEPGLCFTVNCKGPANLAALCRYYGVQLLHFSSDQVFEGTKETPYTESDQIAPLSVYGQSKVAAENAVLHTNPDALVIRMGPLFGPWNMQNFVYKIMAALKEERVVETISDVYISPTYVPDLAHRCLDLLLDREMGIYHLANDAVVSWEVLAQNVAFVAGYDADLIKGHTAQQWNWSAIRPRYTALQSERGPQLPSLDQALEHYLQAIDYIYPAGRIAV
jgi:dTDP-4-dehydrorhamnose reductase